MWIQPSPDTDLTPHPDDVTSPVLTPRYAT
jgi:hypothetical protein